MQDPFASSDVEHTNETWKSMKSDRGRKCIAAVFASIPSGPLKKDQQKKTVFMPVATKLPKKADRQSMFHSF